MEFGIASLLPPLVAIVLALTTRRVLAPLSVGILVGAWLLSRQHLEVDTATTESVLGGTAYRFVTSIHDSVVDSDHLHVLMFTLLLGAMVGVLEAGGSMLAMIRGWTKNVRTKQGGQTLIGLTGLAIFFDDYANTLLVGGTMRSTADRFGISRAKLAYLVDSTAAPVAGLALVSTWVATELSYLQQELVDAGLDQPGLAFQVFLQSIPYRFYPWLALALVFIISRTGRDFGPMLAEESRAYETLQAKTFDKDNAKEELSCDNDSVICDDPEANASPTRHTIVAMFPIVVCIMVVLATLVVTSEASPNSNAQPTTSGTEQLKRIGDIIGTGNSYLSLVIGGAAGLLVAAVGAIGIGGCSWKQAFSGAYQGACQMLPAMAVLWLAWALSSMTAADALDTGGYLASVLSDRVDARLLPTFVFVLSGFIAFATGTSWATMAIVTPVAVSLALRLELNLLDQLVDSPTIAAFSPITLSTFSSVLAGAIFGDHCSPLSDTTVLSSRSCDCDHVLHVRTQMPYACLAGGVCIVGGTLPASLGVSPWICLAGSAMALYGIVRLVGKPGVGSPVNSVGRND